MSSIKSGTLVHPGEKIGVIEMFMPGSGTFERDGIIYSNILGLVNIDMKKRMVQVDRMNKNFSIPQAGQIVYARVDQIRKNSAIVIMTNTDKVEYSAVFEGMVHVSQTSKEYTESMTDAFNEGDIIRARIIQTDYVPYQLSTAGKKLGVVMAFCRNCGEELVLGGQKLNCLKCGNQEVRKISIDYGKVDY